MKEGPSWHALSRLKDGSLSAKELCEKCIDRAVKTRELNAIVTPTYSQARKQAEVAAQTWSRTGKSTTSARKLEGLPIVVKDNFCTKGVHTTCASRMLENYVPPYNATVVQRLFTQGAVLLGKSNMDEYGMGSGSVDSIFGPVRNPWKYEFTNTRTIPEGTLDTSSLLASPQSPGEALGTRGLHRSVHPGTGGSNPGLHEEGAWRVAGGSSGGSAAAVAAGICFGALGSDTGGSTRNPSSYCGVVGLKSSYGLLSRHGLIPLVNSLEVPGIMARSVDDVNTLQNIMAGTDEHDSTTLTDDRFVTSDLPEDIDVKHLHIGIPKEYHAPGLSPDVLDAWRRAADKFEQAGAKVTEVSLPHTQYSILCYIVLCCCEVASNMARYDGIEYGHRGQQELSTEQMYAMSRHEGFNEVVRGRIFAGNFFLLRRNYEQYFLKAQRVRRLIKDDFTRVFDEGVNVLLTPTTLTDAPRYDWFTAADNRTRNEEQDIFTQPINMAGIPAVTVPAGLTSNGLPIGLQFIGQMFKDKEMLTVAKWFEQQVQFENLNLDHLDN
ncbi:glutamyl-tRNA(Gln) amidotransferase subunit A, mitochondrial-like isoform X1 [Mizuhopecten yessoensis]|uniref:glutamyl-tRNA(Gln) amidotransferase subunit A, mitochondrial-like isoform X1 n=1 Tax=Mizuhopecten yessoensis TaxID=6573 RepID=UPI000B45AE08|nr:glutamyl-tRNA(Gln) amidotransferase subunit A, mitochondrial-like isoform X1 [Mizuhopecten yessoensis]